MKSTFFQRLDRYPPALIRLLARNPDGSVMTDTDIAKRGCRHQFAYAADWSGIPIEQADSFLSACRADPMDTNWVRRVNRLTKPSSTCRFTWLQRSPLWPQLKPILAVYAATLKK